MASSFDVTQATAGTLVGGYALGLAVGGPILTAATLRLDRRTVLLCSLTAFVVLVAAGSVAPHFGWFVATRAGAGASQGPFLGAAFTTATAVVPPERAGRALAVVIAGIALGSAASGAAYSAWGPAAVVLTGICLALGALVLAGVTRRIRPTRAEAGSAPVAEHVLVA